VGFSLFSAFRVYFELQSSIGGITMKIPLIGAEEVVKDTPNVCSVHYYF